MNTIHTKVRLENSCGTHRRVLEVRALVDPAMLFLCLPAPVIRALSLEGSCFRYVKQSFGPAQKCRYVGPVTLQCGAHQGFSGAVEYGEEVVIGSLPLGQLGLTLDPDTLQLVSVPVRICPVYTK